MSKLHYKLLYRLDAEDRFLIWFSNEVDGVHVDAAGRIPTFRTDEEWQAYTSGHDLPLKLETPILHDLDVVAHLVKEPDGVMLDCSETLAAWNLFADLARSVPDGGIVFAEADQSNTSIYEKVFLGNNLPAITPEGKCYTPTWSDEEVTAIAELLQLGFDLFRSSIRPSERST